MLRAINGVIAVSAMQQDIKFEAAISKYIQLIFCYVMKKLSVFNLCKI